MNNQPTKDKFLSLPIYQEKQRILDALQSHRIIVVESNTGSGKTTQLPLILLENKLCKEGTVIGMTEPRRIAAVSVSQFIQLQLDKHPEFLSAYTSMESTQVIGYKIRFEDKTSASTKLKIMTDGILLQEFKQDPLLTKYSTIIIDEAHERSLNIDFILGLLRQVYKQRDDLNIVVSSATINTKTFSRFFFNCPIIKINAMVHPVQIVYSPPPKQLHSQEQSRSRRRRRGQLQRRSDRKRSNFSENDLDRLVLHISSIVKKSVHNREGDILIFLPGEKAIKSCINHLSLQPFASKLHMLPLYGRLDTASQELVFDPPPPNTTKVIVATNIAETSITIDTIKVVIDSGRVKLNSFHHTKHISTLDEMPISRASALQRKGRAGRTGPGKCYRLYQKEEFDSFEGFSQEEIYRTDLSEVVLRMANQGIRNFEEFDFISPPQRHSIHSAIKILQELDALDAQFLITNTGSLMAEFPLLPIHARMLVEGIMAFPESLDNIIKVISFLSTPNPFLLPLGEESEARRAHRSFSVEDNDFLSYIRLFDSFVEVPHHEKLLFCEQAYIDMQIMQEICNVHEQLSLQVSDKNIPIGSEYLPDNIISAIARGLIFNICLLEQGNYYRNRMGEKIFIHPGSMMFEKKQLPDVLVAGEVVQTSKKFARAASHCKLEWIRRFSESIYNELHATLKNKQRPGKKRRTSQSYTLSRSVVLAPSSKIEHNISSQIYMAGEKFELQTENNRKSLSLTWKRAKKLVRQLSPAELSRYGRIPCKIVFRNNITIGSLVLSSLHLFCHLYKSSVPFITKIPERYDPSPAGSNKDTERRKRKQLDALVKTCMSVLITKEKKQAPQVAGFCSLETGKNGGQYILPNTHFLTSLYNSMRSLEFLTEEQLEKKLLARTQKAYAAFRGAYQLFETVES